MNAHLIKKIEEIEAELTQRGDTLVGHEFNARHSLLGAKTLLAEADQFRPKVVGRDSVEPSKETPAKE